MKATNCSEDSFKSTQSKSSKKSTKSRSKSSKSELGSKTLPAVTSTSANSSSITVITSNSYVPTTPTTPTSSTQVSSLFEPAVGPSGSGINSTPTDFNSSGGSSSGSRSHHKNYAGFEPRSIKIIWEQHDQSDIELSQEVCTRLAEDASYKLWELVNNIKTYARHSGGVVTYSLVNEVLKDADVPPALGALDSPWDRVDYDGSFFFYSDKILELRDEYQKEITLEMPLGADFARSFIIEEKHVELIQKYMPSLVYVMLYGDLDEFELALQEAAFSPLIAACYRVLLSKIVQILAYKQIDKVSLRCWSLLRSCAVNPYVREVDCREEYYHLAEILICQLIGPLECIKVHSESETKGEQKADTVLENTQEDNSNMKQEPSQQQPMSVKSEFSFGDQQDQQKTQQPTSSEDEFIYQLEYDEDGSNDTDIDINVSPSTSMTNATGSTSIHYSPYFASPVDLKNVEDLCSTLGLLSAMSGYFQVECLFLVMRRLERFFDGRNIATEKEYNYIGRAFRGLVALGEYAFREFIPFIFKFKAEDIPESIWNDFALSATYIHGPDDVFLYEWLEHVCGGDKLQPFMVYFAEYHEKLQTMRHMQKKKSTFKITPKLGARRLEWSTLAAAMCHGDDPNKALRPKPTMNEAFPELTIPNLHLNRSGNIRFKFAGCRPVILRPKTKAALPNSERTDGSTDTHTLPGSGIGHHDIIIAKRKLLKPLTNERRTVPLSSYFYVRI